MSQLLSPHAILNQLQTDSCPHLFAEIALFKVTNDFYASKSNGHFPVLFFIDVSAVFVQEYDYIISSHNEWVLREVR